MDDFASDDFGGALVTVRADTQAFRADIEAMRRSLADGLGGAGDIAGRRIEAALLRAVRSGKLGFEDLKRTALAILSDIAAAAVRPGLQSLGGGKGAQAGPAGFGAQLLGALLGSPGRATGGPVTPGRAYMVGERGPEMFMPAASGRVEPVIRGGGREVRVTINLNAPRGGEPEALARSARQIARAVKSALERS